MASFRLYVIDKGSHAASRDPGEEEVDLKGEVAHHSREGKTWWQPFFGE